MKQLTTQEIQAILDGTKTQFREVIEYGLYAIENDMNEHSIEIAKNYCDLDEQNFPSLKPEMIKHSKHQTGDTLWKDTEYECVVTGVRVERLQDISNIDIQNEGIKPLEEFQGHIRYGDEIIDSIFEVDYEVLKQDWINIWSSTAKDGYNWKDNPYVFVYEFERVKDGKQKYTPITPKLISTVLEVDNVSSVHIQGNSIIYYTKTFFWSYQHRINIDLFTKRMKQWCLKQGYEIFSSIKGESRFKTPNHEFLEEVRHLSKTEHEAVAKSVIWIAQEECIIL